MDVTLCNVIYVDRSIRRDRVFQSRSACAESQPGHPDQISQTGQTGTPNQTSQPDRPDQPEQPEQSVSEPNNGLSDDQVWETDTLANNVQLLASVFGDVHLCATGSACMSSLFDIQDVSMLDLKPTIVLIDIPHDEQIPPGGESRPHSRSPSPRSHPSDDDVPPSSPPAEDIYGLQLLQRIVSEAHLHNLTKLVVPVPVISGHKEHEQQAQLQIGATKTAKITTTTTTSSATAMTRPKSRPLIKRCLRLGASDILFSPIQQDNITSLEIQAYWAHKSAARDQQALMEFRRGRKRSWVGIGDTRPFAYLRESMVAGLMRRICQMEDDNELPVDTIRIVVSARRKSFIATAIGSWHFSAHELADDELVEAAALMFRHAFTVPELESLRIPTDQLICFLIACRAAYNTFVPYHNFRHVVDVLQATFNFLVNIGALPPYPPPPPTSAAGAKPPTAESLSQPRSPMASLIQPLEALTLLITAIGHDVGHPGVNNGFLVVLNTPLAQLYNDRSVLESFHCAAYSQILRRYWNSAFAHTKMRNLMISSILATDMGLHFDYMKKLGSIQDKLAESNTTDGWNGRMFEEQTALACALLIKCADISNVARRHDAAVQWMHILSDEFSRQASMENQLAIKSSLMSQPKKDIVSLFRSQLGFMNIFAIPLFQSVANIMPGLQYCVDELEINRQLFERGIAEEIAQTPPAIPELTDGAFSPRTMTVVIPEPTAGEVEKELPALDHVVTAVQLSNEHEREHDHDHEDEPATPASSAISPMAHANNTHLPVCDVVDFGHSHGVGNDAAARTPIDEEFAHSSELPVLGDMYKTTNGLHTHFDAVAAFAASDPFHVHDGRPFAPAKQRVSEATDGSTSVPSGGGDWASQATSATTGKMPLSPSTQGTSIISRDSLERPSSSGPEELTQAAQASFLASVRTEPEQDGTVKRYPDGSTPPPMELSRGDESSLSSTGGHSSTVGNSGNNKPASEERGLRKKTSRFRMKSITFFRRHVTPSPPIPTSSPDAAIL